MAGLTHAWWEQFGRLRVDEIPDDVRTVATQCILDWMGCAVAGSVEPLSLLLRDEVATTDGPSRVVGTDRRVLATNAAMINGAAGHALDFDDTHTTMGGHPTAPLLPAALALADELGATGAELLTAFVVGFEIESRLGAALGPEHYLKGWHQTSTVGAIGAAAACSRLLGLDHEQFGHAIGIAASSASGLKANFGTMTKPLHAGQAAERGLLAARLARRGFTANPDALDAQQGFAEAAGNGSLRAERLQQPGRWLILDTLFKYHAACYLTHAGIEATLQALGDGAPSPTPSPGSSVDSITLTVNPSILSVCNIERPTTGLEAKFSLRGTQAFVVLGIDTADPAAFDDQRVRCDDVRSVVERVEVMTDPSLRTTQTRSVVIRNGVVSEAFFDSGVPSRDLATQSRKLRAKFDGLARPILGRSAADATADAINNLAELATVHDLVS